MCQYNVVWEKVLYLFFKNKAERISLNKVAIAYLSIILS